MSKYLGKQNFSLGNFPEVGQKQLTWKEEKVKVSDYNGQYMTPEAIIHTISTP